MSVQSKKDLPCFASRRFGGVGGCFSRKIYGRDLFRRIYGPFQGHFLDFMMVLIIGFCGKDPPNFYWENLTLSMAIFSGYFKLPEGTASFVSLFYVLRNLDLNRIWLLFLEPTNTVILHTLEWCVCIHNIYIYI